MKPDFAGIWRILKLGLRMQILPIATGLLLAKMALLNLLTHGNARSETAINTGADLINDSIHWSMLLLGIAITARSFYVAKMSNKKR